MTVTKKDIEQAERDLAKCKDNERGWILTAEKIEKHISEMRAELAGQNSIEAYKKGVQDMAEKAKVILREWRKSPDTTSNTGEWGDEYEAIDAAAKELICQMK